MLDQAKNICTLTTGLEVSMWFVCIILISYESSFLGHHDFEKEGVSSLSVAINFDEVFKYVIQGRSLPSSKYFWPGCCPLGRGSVVLCICFVNKLHNYTTILSGLFQSLKFEFLNLSHTVAINFDKVLFLVPSFLILLSPMMLFVTQKP